MSPQIKLTYFGFPGRAELARLLFAIGDVDFDDERLEMAEYGARMDTLPLGQLPLLAIDGIVYPQSMAIARYAGHLSSLYPTDALERLKVDTVSESLLDGFNAMVDIKWLTLDEATKAEKTKRLTGETLPKIYSLIESKIAGKYVLGDKLSLADVHLFDFTTNMLPAFQNFDASVFPKIQAIVADVKVHPKVASYLAKSQ